MQIIDAFSVLGATPTDSNERLQELLEEKELISDDMCEARSAYADLTNPKKRLKHEIMYLDRDKFFAFNQMIEAEEKATATVHANVLVGLGHWFEEEKKYLFEKINYDRMMGGYALIDNESAISSALEEIRHEFVMVTDSYLDSLTEKKSLAKIFNKIVNVPDFKSFFVDELMAHYELALGEILQEKETACRELFSKIEAICTKFSNGEFLSPYLPNYVAKFEEALKDWDVFAQPLQKNAQVHGGQHKNSEELAHDIRNQVIELCNRSIEKLGYLLDTSNDYLSETYSNVGYGYSQSAVVKARKEFINQIPHSLRLIESLIRIVDILLQVFAELEITSEQLLQDKKDLQMLKSILNRWAPLKIEEEPKEKPKSRKKWKVGQVVHGVFALICLIVMIVGFSVDIFALGVSFLILTVAFGCCCGLYSLLEDKGVMKWIIIVAVVVGTVCGVSLI